MTPVLVAITVGISIERAPEEVYAFISDLRNVPAWATSFCRAVHATTDGWEIEMPEGSVPIRFVAPNAFGVLDHYVGSGPDLPQAVLNPMRVVANGSGSEVMLTLFQLPDMSAGRYVTDLAMVRSDLAILKGVLEGDTGRVRSG